MSNALALLFGEICDDILTVDLESRQIIIPNTVENLGVESDDSVRIMHFQVPRTYCSVDLSQFSIRVNYKNTSGAGGSYDISSFSIEEGMIKFDWVVARAVTVKRGDVKFNVCFREMIGEEVDREFNTTPATLPVLEGLETGEEIVEEDADVFEQLRFELLENADEIVSQYLEEKGDEIKGPKGDPFEYEDFTEEQLRELKGPKGDPFEYEDFTEEQLEDLKGPKGDPFEYEDFTEEQLKELVGPQGVSIQSIVRTAGDGSPGTTDTYTVTLTNGSTTTFKVYNGKDGPAGSGSGDMLASMYDSQAKRQDIFKYVDETAGIPFLGENVTGGSANDTTAFWVGKKSGLAWFSSNDMLVNQPSQYGFLINYINGTDVFQMFCDQNEGDIYFRSGDSINNWFKNWAVVYDSSNLTPDDIGAMSSRVKKESGDIIDLYGKSGNRYSIGNTVTGMPYDGYWWFVDVFATSTDMTLVAHKIGTKPETYIRSVLNGEWGDWHQMPTTNANGELILDGNIKGHYVTGEWLRTVADGTHLTEAAKKIAVLDGSGWIYHRTPEEALSDMGGMKNVAVTASDNGKFMRVVDGKWAAVTVPNAEEASF